MTMMMGGKVHRTRSKARRSAGGVPGAFLQGVDGTRIPLTPDDYRRVREFLLAEPERAVADDERITTGEAARILGVSQRTLTRMLDAGMIPYTRMGERSYRFLRLSDVTDYKRRRDEATSKAFVYGQINVYSVTTKSERYERSYWTRTAAGNGIGGRKAPVPYGS